MKSLEWVMLEWTLHISSVRKTKSIFWMLLSSYVGMDGCFFLTIHLILILLSGPIEVRKKYNTEIGFRILTTHLEKWSLRRLNLLILIILPLSGKKTGELHMESIWSRQRKTYSTQLKTIRLSMENLLWTRTS